MDMLKVFLVEDEIVMREGIKNNIDWEGEGFEFVGEASDGELAWPLIQKTKPDILITDIKMPFMDGLELSRLVKQELPDTRIIILSGYDEFEYAQEAISIGITNYLVKPIAGAKLLEEVKKVGERMLDEEQRLLQKTFEKERMENRQLARQKFFRSLVSGRTPVASLLEEGRKIGFDLTGDGYNIMLFQIFAGGEAEDYSEEQNELTLTIERMTERTPGILMVELGIEGWAFIVREQEGKEPDKVLRGFLDDLERIIRSFPGVEYFGGVGQSVNRLSELNKCFESANKAFSYRYIKERSQIVFRGGTEEQYLPDEDLELSSINLKSLDRKIVERFLKMGLRGESRHFVEEYFASLGEGNIRSLMFRQYIAMDIYFAALAMLEQLGCEPGNLTKRCGDLKMMSAVFSDVEQTKEYLRNILETAVEMRETVSRKKYSALLKDAQSYIEQNYNNEDISLNTVAASVNLSPNHFSTIFSQETGQTFVEFLTKVRMEKAKELLRGTPMRMAEIAYGVGYKDPHYFSYLFKKTQDCTPREFRARSQGKD